MNAPTNKDDFERIAGAKACVASLVELVRSANNLPVEADDAVVFLSCQSGAAEKLVAQFGPLTARQEGAFRALAEYIHASTTTGRPDLDCWTPCVAQTPEELAAWAGHINEVEQVTESEGGEL